MPCEASESMLGCGWPWRRRLPGRPCRGRRLRSAGYWAGRARPAVGCRRRRSVPAAAVHKADGCDSWFLFFIQVSHSLFKHLRIGVFDGQEGEREGAVLVLVQIHLARKTTPVVHASQTRLPLILTKNSTSKIPNKTENRGVLSDQRTPYICQRVCFHPFLSRFQTLIRRNILSFAEG